MSSLLAVDELSVEYMIRGQTIRALDGVDLSVFPGQAVGVVGESGSGKSTLGLTIGRLLPPNAHRVGGDLAFSGSSVFEFSDEALRDLRTHVLGYVFQSPISALDPTMTADRQLFSVLGSRSRANARRELVRVGIGEPVRVGTSYPHELSGGTAQRVAIALALAHSPLLVVADEPTASLDASIRDQVLRLLVTLCADTKASVLLLMHDLRAVQKFCETVAVMYGGRIVESGNTKSVLNQPAHPYTHALLRAAPGAEHLGDRLQPIDGAHPVLTGRSQFCAFAPRCKWATLTCRTVRPETRALPDGRQVVCHRAEEVLSSNSAQAS